MKILFLLVLLSIISCTRQHDPYPNIEVIANVKRVYDTIKYYNDTLKTRMFDIELSVTNKSKNPISFWLMSCSREDNFIINNDYVYFRKPGCDSNVPLIYTLKSNDLISWDATIIKYYHTRYHFINATKLGIIFIDSIRCKGIQDYESIIGDKSKQDKIVWSNPLILDDFK